MGLRVFVFCVLFFTSSVRIYSQNPETFLHKVDSCKRVNDTLGVARALDRKSVV